MKIRCTFNGNMRIVDLDKTTVLIGRLTRTSQPDLPLPGDPAVSRMHAKLWVEGGVCWIEDRQSAHGTFVNGQPIDQPHRLTPTDVVMVGDTELRVLLEPSPASSLAEQPLEFPTLLDMRNQVGVALEKSPDMEKERLGLLLDLPLQLAAVTEWDTLFQLIVDRVISVIPGAMRGALLLCEGEGENPFALKASSPADEPPAFSRSLAQRAVSGGNAFIWNKAATSDELSESIRDLRIETGMYAPLCWNNAMLGVICVDNPGRRSAFCDEDLRLLAAVAQYAAAALSNRRLQATLAFNATVLERLLTNFSPKVRTWLMHRARAGALEPGGTKSEVTILMSDVRGFTAQSALMDANDTVKMLNDYFSELVDVIFAHDGTIDKFIGDGILAVFGSPEPDEAQHAKAVRAALAMQEKVHETSARRAARGEPICRMGIGLHCGSVLHGFIGGAKRLEFTVIGNNVNRTSRFCDGADGGEVILSPEIYEHLTSVVAAEQVEINTKHEGIWQAWRVSSLRA